MTNGRADDVGGASILVVEDEFLLSVMLEDDLRSAGHTVIGPYHDLSSATSAARRHDFDLAILDVNLNGEMVYPLADELRQRGRPFILLSGYGLRDLPGRFGDVPRLAKPYHLPALAREIARLITGACATE